MKKDSSRKEQKQREIIGIDLGDKVSHYVVINEDGEVVEEGTFRNQITSIEKHFRGEPRRIALEVGAQSAWITRQLQQMGHEVIVANARQVKWITASDQKRPRRCEEVSVACQGRRAATSAHRASQCRATGRIKYDSRS